MTLDSLSVYGSPESAVRCCALAADIVLIAISFARQDSSSIEASLGRKSRHAGRPPGRALKMNEMCIVPYITFKTP